MTNNEILKALSAIECTLYYRAEAGSMEGVTDEANCKVYNLVKQALEAWHEATGETL